MADKVLIVNGDASMQAMLTKIVRSENMAAVCAQDGREAMTMILEEGVDLILLSGHMKGMDCHAALESLRNKGVKTPVLVVCESCSEFDILYALNLGADDYATKPFSPVILGAKMKALIRRSRNSFPGAEQIIVRGPFTYNTSTLRLYKHDAEIQLSSKENAMMKLFLDNVNRVFSKDMLYDLIWGESVIDENAIMVYINRLRYKIEDDPANPKYIQTVRGIGYRFTI